jgi:hypothetical protein
VTEHGVDPAERLTPEEAQDSVPAARRNEADDECRRQRHSRDQPACVRAQRAQGRRVNGRPRCTRRAVRRRGLVDPAAQGDEVQQHVGVSDQASYDEQSSLEQQDAPEDRVIAQRLEPEEPGEDVDAERQRGQHRNTEPEQSAIEGLDQTLHDPEPHW